MFKGAKLNKADFIIYLAKYLSRKSKKSYSKLHLYQAEKLVKEGAYKTYLENLKKLNKKVKSEG